MKRKKNRFVKNIYPIYMFNVGKWFNAGWKKEKTTNEKAL
jgi:hypothetical protein